MKKKVKLTELHVQSFITSAEQKNINGGKSTACPEPTVITLITHCEPLCVSDPVRCATGTLCE